MNTTQTAGYKTKVPVPPFSKGNKEEQIANDCKQ